jgi:hypothetical protein
MRAILILTPYILIPLIITLLFKRFNHLEKSQTYKLTSLIIFFYPFLFFWIDEYLNPPPLGLRSGNRQFVFFLFNLIILLPITLYIQYIFNTMLLTEENTDSEDGKI